MDELREMFKNDQDYLLGKLIDLSKHIENSETPNRPISMNQIRTLVHIKRKGIVKPGAIAERFNITPATVTSQIDKLVQGGWLVREYDSKDRRAINIKTTSKTDKELQNMLEEALKDYKWVLEALTVEEQKKLLELLIKIDDCCHKKEE